MFLIPTKSSTHRQLVLCVLSAFILCSFAIPDYGEAGSSRHRVTKYKRTVSRKWKSRNRHKRITHGIRAKAVYCINLRNNGVVFARRADRRLPVASLTKLMTALLVMENLPLERKVKLPRRVPNIPESVVHLRSRDVVTVRDLLHGLLMASGNDCAEALAYAFPGGRKRFIARMNRKALALGARNTVFYTPSGLDARVVRRARRGTGKRIVRFKASTSTARDMAKIARAAFANETIGAICLKKTYVMSSRILKRGYHIRNTNRLLREGLPLMGGKTGYTSRAKRCMASKFKTGRGPILIVVLGSRNHFRDTKIVYRKAVRTMRAHRQRQHRNAGKRIAGYSYAQSG
jgi:D-alanyl-D-alanine carboxypeptidase